MALTIANWTISLRFQRTNTTPARATDPAADQMHRRKINDDMAREREQAHTRWMLLGGNVNR
jgi:hypothetical protein